jgi:hypothetical protein
MIPSCESVEDDEFCLGLIPPQLDELLGSLADTAPDQATMRLRVEGGGGALFAS